jgi:adenylate kinase family enzyme
VNEVVPGSRLRRIVVVGTTGSGKTTLARQLSQRLGIAHVELDALHWEPDWTPAEPEAFRARTSQALGGAAWVTDGNYGKVRDIVWSRADTVVWLDYALPIILGRLLWRTVRRVATREELWNRNREQIRGLIGRESLIVWALQTYRRRRREYPALLRKPEFAHLTVVHLRSPHATREWLERVPTTNGAGRAGDGA